MTLQSGQSELDTVTVKLLDKSTEIKTWDKVSVKSDFLSPTGGWDLTLSSENGLNNQDLFQQGDKIQICVNDKPQITGYIEQINVRQSRSSGIIHQLSGRDILGPVVSSNVDPKLKIVESMNILDLLNVVLKDFGIGTIYNSDALNINIMTGINTQATRNKTAVSTQIAFAKPVAGDNQSVELEYQSESVNYSKAANRPDLKTLTLKDLKPKQAEGSYDFVNRILSRLGFRMWAMADGSGVVVDRPDFTSTAKYSLVRRLTDSSNNNLIDGELNINIEYQPAAIVASGTSLSSDDSNITVKVLAINEFNGLDGNGEPIQIIKDIQARNPGIKILPLRTPLIERKFSSSFKPVILYLKDDESRNISQISSFARRQLSLKQKEYFVYKGSTAGFSSNNQPYAINTLIDVLDEVTGVNEPLWVFSRSFTKSRGEGTITNLVLMKRFSLELNGE